MQQTGERILQPIEGFRGYFINKEGQVWSEYRRHCWLTPSSNGTGYHKVVLCRDEKKHTKYVHRLVAETFLPNPDNKPQVNHKNGIRHDNRAKNLEWATRSENHLHAYRELGRVHHHAKPIRCVETGDIYSSATFASKQLGIPQTCISAVVRGVQSRAGGFHWELV